MLHHLHQSQRISMAHGVGVKARLGLHNRQNQRGIDTILIGGFTHHRQVFVRTLIQVVWHHRNRNGVNHMQTRGAALQFILNQIVSKGFRATLPANRLTGIIQHLAIQQRLFTDFNIVGVE